jgi:DNA-binding MarR family transcriptional regulator
VFVLPHAANDAVGEMAFVGASDFSSGLAVGGFAGKVAARRGMITLLGDADDVQDAIDAPVAAGVEPVTDRLVVAFASTWQHRELRILNHVVQAWEDGEYAAVADIAEALDLDYDQVVRVVDVLRKDDYLTGVGVAEDPYLLHIEPTAKARRAVDQWPMPGAEMYDRLLALLDERIAAETDEPTRTRFQTFRDGAADVGRSALGGILVELMKFGAGMGM